MSTKDKETMRCIIWDVWKASLCKFPFGLKVHFAKDFEIAHIEARQSYLSTNIS